MNMLQFLNDPTGNMGMIAEMSSIIRSVMHDYGLIDTRSIDVGADPALEMH